MVIVLLALGLTAMAGSGSHPQLVQAVSSDWNPLGAGVLTLVALAIWGFVGAEFTCPLVEESRQPERNIPLAMILGIVVIFVTTALYSIGALFYVPREQLAASALPHYLYATALLGEAGKVFLVVAAITATCSTLNSSLAAVPRMLYGMAHNGQVFPQFKLLSKRYNTPWVAVLFVSLITGAPVLLMGNDPATIGLLFILVIFVTMVYGPIAAMLVELFPTRIRYTSMSLPYHIGNGWFGGLLPATSFAIVASTGDIYAGLWYPVIFALITVVVGFFFLPETKDVDITK